MILFFGFDVGLFIPLSPRGFLLIASKEFANIFRSLRFNFRFVYYVSFIPILLLSRLSVVFRPLFHFADKFHPPSHLCVSLRCFAVSLSFFFFFFFLFFSVR